MKKYTQMFKIKSLLLIAAMGLTLVGCNNWLDIEPENDLIKQEFWKTSDDVMAVLSSTYDAMRETTEKSFLMGEIRADFLVVADGEFSDYARIGENDISTTNYKVKWNEYYNTINLANTVMYYAPIMQKVDNSLSDAELSGIEAEMLFLRSLSYFYLVRIWKDVPLILTATISDTIDFYVPKSEENIVLNQVVSDLKRASGLAFTNEFFGTVFYKGRANKYAIQALLADVLLWQQKYDECVIYCDSIINTGIFSLEPNSSWFDLYYPGNSISESIFEIQYDDNIDGQENPIYYSLLNNLEVVINKIAYSTAPKDLRYFNKRGPIWKLTGTDETGSFSRTRDFSSERDANFIYYRYADVLLMKAESLAELGLFEEANNLLREVSERANISHTATYSLESFRSVLLAERGREFALEGKRWFDILRFAKKDDFADKQVLVDILLGKATDAKELAIMRTKVIDTMSYYLPIHLDEIQRNKNLMQNPFYDR